MTVWSCNIDDVWREKGTNSKFLKGLVAEECQMCVEILTKEAWLKDRKLTLVNLSEVIVLLRFVNNCLLCFFH